VPLSEHEQRLLEQIEQALYAEDPKFANTYRGTDLRTVLRRRLLRCVALLVAGAGALAAGVVLKLLPLAAAGGGVIALSLVLALIVWIRHPRARRRPVPAGPTHQLRAPSPRHAGLIARLEERWQRRMDQRGR
jgi:hypothetical protein